MSGHIALSHQNVMSGHITLSHQNVMSGHIALSHQNVMSGHIALSHQNVMSGHIALSHQIFMHQPTVSSELRNKFHQNPRVHSTSHSVPIASFFMQIMNIPNLGRT